MDNEIHENEVLIIKGKKYVVLDVIPTSDEERYNPLKHPTVQTYTERIIRLKEVYRG